MKTPNNITCPKCGSENVEESKYIITDDGEKDYDNGDGRCFNCGWDYIIAYV